MSTISKQTPQRFWRIIQSGDLLYSEIIPYGILLFGCTKHGKTTLSHFLSNHILQPYQNSDNQILYKVKPPEDSNAKIGQSPNSQTQVPNKFPTQLLQPIKNLPIFLIDNPGYNDSFGIFRVLSNAYFHYRIFTKVQNAKFILVIDYNMIIAPFHDVHAVFREFLRSFKLLHEIVDQIVQATSVVMTKVQKNDHQYINAIQRMKTYAQYINQDKCNAQFTENQKQFINKLTIQCEKNIKKRLKIFHKAKLNVCPSRGTFLQQLNNSTKFFSRSIFQHITPISTQKLIDTKYIQFSQSKTIRITMAKDNSQQRKMQQLIHKLQQKGQRILMILVSFIKDIEQTYICQLDNLETKQQKNSCMLSLAQKLHILLQQNTKRSSSFSQKSQQQPQQQQQIQQQQYSTQPRYQSIRNSIFTRIQQIISQHQKHKQNTFIDRLKLLIKIFYIFSTWDVTKVTAFVNDKKEEFVENYHYHKDKGENQMKIQFESILLEISHLFNKKSKNQLVKFMYQLQRLFNEFMIFQLIIGKNQLSNKINARYLIYSGTDKIIDLDKNDYLSKTIQSFQNFTSNDILTLTKPHIYPFSLSISLLTHHLFINPLTIRYTFQHQQQLLYQLSKYPPLSHSLSFQTCIIKLKYFQKKYYPLIQILSSLSIQPNQSIQPHSQPSSLLLNNIILEQSLYPHGIEYEIIMFIVSGVRYLQHIKMLIRLLKWNQYQKYQYEVKWIREVIFGYIMKMMCYLGKKKITKINGNMKKKNINNNNSNNKQSNSNMKSDKKLNKIDSQHKQQQQQVNTSQLKQQSKQQQLSQQLQQQLQLYTFIILQSLDSNITHPQLFLFLQHYILSLQSFFSQISIIPPSLLSSQKSINLSPVKKSSSSTNIINVNNSVFNNNFLHNQKQSKLSILPQNKLTSFLSKRKQIAQKIIKIKIKYVKILMKLFMKEKAMKICLDMKKYKQYCGIQYTKSIDEIVREVMMSNNNNFNCMMGSINQQNNQYNKNRKNNEMFQISIKLKKILGKFIKKYQYITPYLIFSQKDK